MRRKKSKAQLYSNFIEISIDPSSFNNFGIESGLSAFFENMSTSEEFLKLKSELFRELIKIIDTCLTKKQKEIIKMTYIEGMTQQEISEKLGNSQSATHKAIRGNIDYNHNKKRYGGAIKKIRKLCLQNKKIQDLLNQIKEKSCNE